MIQLLIGDCRETLKTLADASAQCCVTSPPYFGLRDYGMEAQIGLEQTPDAYVAELVAVFREVKRVLREDGTLWLNLGDSYAGSWGAQSRANGRPMPLAGGGDMLSARQIEAHPRGTHTGSLKHTPGLKPKDLIGIPWRVAFALQADGWYLRQDIIWAKPNVMPESVKDRCTKSHEYVFMLTQSERYFYDHEAIKEPCAEVSVKRSAYGWDCDRASVKNGSAPKQDGHGRRHAGFNARWQEKMASSGGIHVEAMGSRFVSPLGRNKRDVWFIPAKGYSGAHFAVMPEALVEPCILAGTKAGDTVLDPFLGSGTVARVAQRLGRDWIGCELNPEYASLIHERTEQTAVAL